MFEGIAEFLGKLWQSVVGIFSMFFPKQKRVNGPAARPAAHSPEPRVLVPVQEQVAPAASRLAGPVMEDGRFNPSDQAAPPALSAEAKTAAYERIKISAYGEKDISAFDRYKEDRGWNDRAKAHSAEQARDLDWWNAYGQVAGGNGQASNISDASRLAEARRVLDEYQPRIAAHQAEAHFKMAANPTRIEDYLRLNKNAGLAQQALAHSHGQLPVVEYANDLSEIHVVLPSGSKEAQIRVSRMPDSDYLTMDVVPKAGSPIHIDHLTLADVNRMTILHPGDEGYKISINASGTSGVSLRVAGAGGELIDPRNQALISMDDHVAVNGMRYASARAAHRDVQAPAGLPLARANAPQQPSQG